ncbi:unnamed protein product [Porites evermanni]|uniref:G-protein coupled receptors family 1 profile domain-containing protein n=1 Tax=Porites evermanni TaxID=104178 RepID=A0ABN8MM41_9CNID|nr:unnamed protein product [Porites evermanni]
MAFADVVLGALCLPLYLYVWVGPSYQLWDIAYEIQAPLLTFWDVSDTIFSQASLISAVFISCERFFAVYWPLRQRTLSMRAYRIVIAMVWSLAVLVYIQRNIASHQLSRASQNKRLTNTLLFVSAIAVLSWLPLVIANYLIFVHEADIPRNVLFYYIINVINFINSILNPVVYVLRIPVFRQWLSLRFLRRHTVINDGVEERDDRPRAATLTSIVELRKLTKDRGRKEEWSEQEILSTNFAFVFEAVLIVAGNLLTIAFFAMKKKLRKKSLLLVINMAFADVMLGAVSLPLYIYLWVGPHFNLWPFKASLEILFFICYTIFSQASLISAVFISCERFFAIFWALKHKTLSMRAHRFAVFMV